MATLSLSLPKAPSSSLAMPSGYHGKTSNAKVNVNPNMLRTKFVKPLRGARLSIRAAAAATADSTVQNDEEKEDEAMGTDALHQFINLNLGYWDGYFYQFDDLGNVTQRVKTKLAVSSYGEEELVSLLQTLKIKQPSSKTSISDQEDPEWDEYKLRETNMFTVDRHQQIGFFPEDKAYSLRHQSAEMLDKVLRAGVLGEDDTDEESPKDLKVPSHRPSIVCENCLYSLDGGSRMRAFHVMDKRGLADMIGVFHETRERDIAAACVFDNIQEKNEDRIQALLGHWSGHSVTKRSGVYGATIAEADIDLVLEMDENRRLIQDVSSTSGGGTNILWTGTLSGGLVTFDGGFQMTLLPGGMYLACPTSVGGSVTQSQSFHLEFCWMESPDKRRRLVRTYDVQGLAVSTTYINEIKV